MRSHGKELLMRRTAFAGCLLLVAMAFASGLPAAAQVEKATVKIDGMI